MDVQWVDGNNEQIDRESEDKSKPHLVNLFGMVVWTLPLCRAGAGQTIAPDFGSTHLYAAKTVFP
jgi:hypothetical protein